MRGLIIFSVLAILLLNLTQASLLVGQQPNALYNYGDIVQVPIILKATTNVYGMVQMSLICNGKETIFYMNGVKLCSMDSFATA